MNVTSTAGHIIVAVIATQIAAMAITRRATIGNRASALALAGAAVLLVDAILIGFFHAFVRQLVSDKTQLGERVPPIMRAALNASEAVQSVLPAVALVLLSIAIFAPRPDTKSTMS